MRYFPQFFLIKKPEKGLHNPEIGFRVQSSQHTTKPQTSNDGACRQGWQGQNTGPSLAAVEKYQTNERGSSMTAQLAALEARIEAEHRADEAMRMQQAMKAVDFVSKWKPPHPATYGLRNKQTINRREQ